MFKLRDEHRARFQESFLETLAERCMDHLRTQVEWAVYSISDPILRRMVDASIRRAMRIGIHTDNSVIAFVHLAFVVAPNLDEHPLVCKAGLRGTPDELPFLASDELDTEDWKRVRERSDPKAWELEAPEDV